MTDRSLPMTNTGAVERAAREWLDTCRSRPDWEPSVLMSRAVTTITTPWQEVRDV
jgi:hypothetical protein